MNKQITSLAKTLRTMTFCLFCLIASGLTPVVGQAQTVEDVFSIKNVQVDVTDRSAARARTLALEQAVQTAFDRLMQKLLKPEDLSRVQLPSGLGPQNYLLGFDVVEERNSTRRYIATLNYSFNPSLIREMFGLLDIPYSEISGRPFLMLPVHIRAGLAEIWNPDNPLVGLLNNIDQTNNLIQFQLPTGSFQDQLTIEGQAVVQQQNLDRLTDLKTRHEAEDVVVVTYEEKLCEDYQACVELIHWRLSMPDNRQSHIILKDELFVDRINQALTEVQQDIETGWKLNTMTRYGEYQQVFVEARFVTINDWVTMKEKMQKISLIQGLTVDEITYPRIALTIKHLGGLEQLRLSLSQQGLFLEEIDALDLDPDMPANSWRIVQR